MNISDERWNILSAFATLTTNRRTLRVFLFGDRATLRNMAVTSERVPGRLIPAPTHRCSSTDLLRLVLVVSIVTASQAGETVSTAISCHLQTRVVSQNALPVLVNLNIRLTSEQYSSDLANNKSLAYTNLKKRITKSLTDVMTGQLSELFTIVDVTFTPGSVVVRYALVVNTAETMTTIVDTVKAAVRNGTFGTFDVNPYSIGVTKSALFGYYGQFTLKNRPYKADLANSTTSLYTAMSTEVDRLMRSTYGPDLVAVRDVMFWNGSIIVTYRLILKTAHTVSELRDVITKYISDSHGIGLFAGPKNIKYSESSLFKYYGTLTIPSRPYSSELANMSSSLYKEMTQELFTQLRGVYCNDIEDIANTTFSKGSVIVNYMLVFKRHHTTAELTEVLKNYVRAHDGLLGLFVVSVDSIKFSDRVSFSYYGKFILPKRPFKDDFANKSSTIYKEMSRHVDEKVRHVFDGDVAAVSEATFSKGSVIVTYNVEMKRFYSLEQLTNIMTKYIKDHNNLLGLFYVSTTSITFSDIDICRISPCQNGGTCLNLVDVYRCFCVGDFKGANCESPNTNKSTTSVAIAVTVVVGLVIICVIIGWFVIRRRQQPSQQDGTAEMTGPNNPESDTYETLAGDKHDVDDVYEQTNLGGSSYTDTRNAMEYDDSTEQQLPVPQPRQVNIARSSVQEPATPDLAQQQVNGQAQQDGGRHTPDQV